MPKSKPDRVVVHRIELQESERELANLAVGSWSFKSIADPFIRIVNDNTSLLLILTLISGYLGFKYLPPAAAEGVGLIVDWIDQFEAAVEQGSVARERFELAGRVFARGPFWSGLDVIEFLTGANIPDFGAGFEPGQ